MVISLLRKVTDHGCKKIHKQGSGSVTVQSGISPADPADEVRQLRNEVEYLRQEVDFLKKISSIRTSRKQVRS